MSRLAWPAGREDIEGRTAAGGEWHPTSATQASPCAAGRFRAVIGQHRRVLAGPREGMRHELASPLRQAPIRDQASVERDRLVDARDLAPFVRLVRLGALAGAKDHGGESPP
jgi:hypothetical protein